MIKRVICEYECEKCGNVYRLKKEAKRCEKRGVEDVSRYPRGTVFGFPENHFYSQLICTVNIARADGHYAKLICWITRDIDGVPDNTFEEQGCFSARGICPPDKNKPAYKRMIKMLLARQVKPIIFMEARDADK